MKRLVSVGLLLLLAAGCTNTKFVYKPSAPVSGGTNVPVKIAILPFADGTENFKEIGPARTATDLQKFNLAKTGLDGWIDALPPEFWAKAFADDLAASGRFEAVRFVYDRSELTDEAFLVEGALQKADLEYSTLGWNNEIALFFRVAGRADGRTAWERVVRKAWRLPAGSNGCMGIDYQCQADKLQASVHGAMREMFDEAGADLARTLAPLAGGGAGADAKPSGAPPSGPAPGSVDETIESILKGK